MIVNRIQRIACVATIVWFLGAGAVWAQDDADGPRDPQRQDPRFTNKLRWVSPPGELPGTYADYLQRHPLRPVRFSNARLVTSRPQAAVARRQQTRQISILVDDALYPTISVSLSGYETDLTLDGYSVFTETVSGGSPEDIKAWVQARYDGGSEGVVFVGDITAAWAEVSGSVFPSDLFYMDLDGYWEDADEDGVYEIHDSGSGDQGPEVYVARIYAHTLHYDTESNMVNGYFAKAHAQRTGSLTQPWRGLEYVEEDWFDMYVAADRVYGEDLVRHDYGYHTTAADYLDQMDLGQHFVQVCVHSWSGGHGFGTRPTESTAYAHTYVHSPSSRTAQLRLGSDDGIKVWLNGSNVCTHDVYQGWVPDEFITPVTLNEGWNRMLCKVSQGGGTYQFSARFTDAGGTTLSDLKYRVNDPAASGEEGQFVRGWLLNGFHQDSSDNFWDYLTTNYLSVSETTANPSEGEVMGGKTWATYSSGSPYVDLGSHGADADFGACYAFARVYADAGTSCELWLGYEDGARVWLNGQQVLYDNRYGGFSPDLSRVGVSLNAGENRLLVKVSEWMGAHGFSARLCHSDGSPVDGLTYDPEPAPVSHIGDWLVNGPYVNPDLATRLSEDYLVGEAEVSPSEGDPAPLGLWERGIGSGYPFDIGVFYDRDGGTVTSQDIQDRDPPVLFYNLFACGPGRFTDNDYLAGSYIFNTTYGLITLASAKSGSMLNFGDFMEPLGEGKTIGVAFHEWFDAQSPFELWEREWYYGMVLNGDPTLRPVMRGDFDRDGDVDDDDRVAFEQCFTGSGGGPAPPGCERGDFDGDEDVDCDDWHRFMDAWTQAGQPSLLPQCAAAMPEAPQPDPLGSHVDKNRYISMVIPALAGAGEATAIRVRLTSVHHPAAPPEAPDFGAWEGRYRWVNSLNETHTCPDSPIFETTFKCAALGCEPEYRAWSTELGGEVLCVTGAAVVPSSLYDVAQLASSCQGNEATCAAVSEELPISTSLFGNVDNDPQLNVLDVAEVVDHLKGVGDSLYKPRVHMRANVPDALGENVGVLDIATAVDAVKEKPYGFAGDFGPCTDGCLGEAPCP